MPKKILLVVMTFLFLFQISATAEENSRKNYHKFRDWEDNFDFGDWDIARPFIEVNYGFGNPDQKKFSRDFGKIGLAELKLGYIKKYETVEDYILETNESYFFGSNLSTDLSSEEIELGEVETKLWRFGIGKRDSYGYGTEMFAVLPYHQWGFVWSQLETDAFDGEMFAQLNPLSTEYQNNKAIIDRYRDAFRFGTIAEGGVRVEFVDFVSVNAGYEAAVIYPRHLFWKQAGSYLIEKAGIGLIDEFVEAVFDSSPTAAPVVSFLLKNGYSYAFFKLKQEDMNWPFSTESPFTYETFKLGVTFTF